jgi:hypothetical protein
MKLNKDAIKAVMLEHLQTLGWPNVPDPNRMVFEEAENMFKLLVSKNLVPYASWEEYYMAAITQYERAELRKAGFNV